MLGCRCQRVVDLQAGEEFVCKECGKPLQEIQNVGSGGSRKRLLIIAAALVAITAGAATWLFWPKSRYPEEPPSTAAPADSAKRENRDYTAGNIASINGCVDALRAKAGHPA